MEFRRLRRGDSKLVMKKPLASEPEIGESIEDVSKVKVGRGGVRRVKKRGGQIKYKTFREKSMEWYKSFLAANAQGHQRRRLSARYPLPEINSLSKTGSPSKLNQEMKMTPEQELDKLRQHMRHLHLKVRQFVKYS